MLKACYDDGRAAIPSWIQCGDEKMENPIGFLAFLLFVLGTSPQTLAAGNLDGAEPYLVKGKFELPLNTSEINGQWKALGYRQCKLDGKGNGWTKGEHTHSWYALFAGKAGKMEFVIQGQRFVPKPGDELYYPKDAVMAAKNLHDGRSEWFECRK